MPCNSDYLEPSKKEKDSKEVANHILYVDSFNIFGFNSVWISSTIKHAACGAYGDPGALEEMVVKLCGALTYIEKHYPNDFERILYDGRSRRARALADWWEVHQKADKKRVEKEDRQLIKHFKEISKITNCVVDEIIDSLIGVCFDEEEAGKIKQKLSK